MNSDNNLNSNVYGEECNNIYKSCFARSVVVNSQYKLTKYLDQGNQKTEGFNTNLTESNLSTNIHKSSELVQTKKNTFKENQRMNFLLNDYKNISKVPVENIVHQSKISTLQWQLRETEKSRSMYKNVMKEVVTFLEKVHQSLDSLNERINNKPTVSRSKSEHQIMEQEKSYNGIEDYSTFRDFTWRRSKKQEYTDECSPEKLSQEAFRLLRTAQSLLNTQEPNLIQNEDDKEFLSQLAKEFPPKPNIIKPQRTTSFSLSPKLIMPENDARISTAFNRKLSLQLNETRQISKKPNNCGRYNEQFLFLNEKNDFANADVDVIVNNDKSNSPASSISSVEVESGFSSMNSFQDVGLPKVEVIDDNVFISDSSGNNEDDVRLWHKFDSNALHKRCSSTPVKSNSNPIWV